MIELHELQHIPGRRRDRRDKLRLRHVHRDDAAHRYQGQNRRQIEVLDIDCGIRTFGFHPG
jgi:hypothetical protein